MTGGTTLALDGGQVASLFLVLMRCTGLRRRRPDPRPPGGPRHGQGRPGRGPGHRRSSDAAPPPRARCRCSSPAPIELLIGLSLGFMLGLGFPAIGAGGAPPLAPDGPLARRGLQPDVATRRAPPLDPFFSVLAGLLFLALDLHLAMVGALARSFVAAADRRRLAGRPAPVRRCAVIALALELGCADRAAARPRRCSSSSWPSPSSRARSRRSTSSSWACRSRSLVGIVVVAWPCPTSSTRRPSSILARPCVAGARTEERVPMSDASGPRPRPSGAGRGAAQGRGRRSEPRVRAGGHPGRRAWPLSSLLPADRRRASSCAFRESIVDAGQPGPSRGARDGPTGRRASG